MGLASGFVPVSELSSNSTSPVPFADCVVPGTHDYAGQLVSAWQPVIWSEEVHDWLHTIDCLCHDTALARCVHHSMKMESGAETLLHLGAVSTSLGVAMQCDAINGDVTHDTWRLRCSFPVYLIAMSATAGALNSVV